MTFPRSPQGAFTLLETMLALALFALLAGALYATASAALEATRAAMDDQALNERLGAFLRAARNSLASLPADGRVELRINKFDPGGTPELVFSGAGRVFGFPLIGQAQAILSAPAMADGTRAFCLALLPPNPTEAEIRRAGTPQGRIVLLPRVERVEWAFWHQDEWRTEWPQGAGRPELVRLRFAWRDAARAPVEAIFWLPPVQLAPPQPPTEEGRLLRGGSESPTP